MTAARSPNEQLSFITKLLIDLKNINKDRLSPHEVKHSVERMKSSTIDNPDLDHSSKEAWQRVLTEDSSPLIQELQSATYPINLARAWLAELFTLYPYTCAQNLFGLPVSLTNDAHDLIQDKTKAQRVIEGRDKLANEWEEKLFALITQGKPIQQLSVHSEDTLKGTASKNETYGFHQDVELLLQVRLATYQSSLLPILDQLLQEEYLGFTTRVDLLSHLIIRHIDILASSRLQISIFPYMIWQGKRFGNSKEQSDQYIHHMLRIFKKYWARLSDAPFPGDKTTENVKNEETKTKADNPFLKIFRDEKDAEIFLDFLEDELNLTSENGTKWNHKNNTFLGLRDVLYELNYTHKGLLLNPDYEYKASIGRFLSNTYNKNLRIGTIKNPLTQGSERIKEMFPKDLKERFQ